MDNQLTEEMLKQCKQIQENTKNRSMGIGPLGDPTITFVRKFRWTMRGTNLREHFIKKVAFDFKKKLIDLDVMEVVCQGDDDIDVQRWLEAEWRNEQLTFATYDGCGTPLYEYKFTGLELVEDKSDFDYTSSEESSRKIKVSYTDYTRTFMLAPKGQVTSYPKKCFKWKLQSEDSPNEYLVKTEMRAALDVEETEINFLNAKTWIPGKATWQDIGFKLDRQFDMGFLTKLISNEQPTLLLHLYSGDLTHKFETWVLKNCRLLKMRHEEDQYEIGIRYTEAAYRNHCNDGARVTVSKGVSNETRRESDDQPCKKGECQPAS
jgi:hypothetical protein